MPKFRGLTINWGEVGRVGRHFHCIWVMVLLITWLQIVQQGRKTGGTESLQGQIKSQTFRRKFKYIKFFNFDQNCLFSFS